MNTPTDSMRLFCVNHHNVGDYIRQFFAREEIVKEKCLGFFDWGTKVRMREQQDLCYTVSRLRRLIPALSRWTPRFDPRRVYNGFVVDKVALGQDFLRVLKFFPVSIINLSLWL